MVTPALLADVLPELDAEAALRWLSDCAFADERAGGVTLHELVRRPYRAELWERTGELRARAAVSLHARGELIDLADLVQDPAIRSGFGWDGSIDHHVTGPQPGDEAVVPRAFCERDPSTCSSRATPRAAPCGYSIAYTAGERPAVRDERLERWLAHAPAGSIVWRDSVDLTRDPRSRIQALLNMAAILRCGLPNPRYAYLPIASRAGQAFSAAVGARHRPRARRRRRAVPRARLRARRAARRAARPRAARGRARAARRPRGAAQPARARRRRSRRCAPSSTTRSCARSATPPDERLLRDVLVRGYFEPGASHEHTARELHLSRAAYFRRLRSASERVAAFMDSSSTA